MVTPYTPEDKELLLRLYDEATEFGAKPNWANIAAHFPTRNAHALQVHCATLLKKRGPTRQRSSDDEDDTDEEVRLGPVGREHGRRRLGLVIPALACPGWTGRRSVAALESG